MFKKLKGTTRLHLLTYTLIAVFLAGVAWAGVTNLDSLILRPTIDDDYSLKLQNRDGTDKLTVDYDGALVHTGNQSLTGDISITGGLYESGASKTNSQATAKRGFVLDGSNSIVYIDATAAGVNLDECEYGVGPVDGTGVTVEFPVPSAILDGWPIEIRKIDSGATDVFAVIGNYGTAGVSEVYLFYNVDGISGATDAPGSANNIDSQYDGAKFRCFYASSAVSGYFYLGHIIDGVVP